MLTRARKVAAATLISGLLTIGAAGPAMAQQNGLVNVEVGDVTILQDVNIGVVAQVAANICGVKVGPVVLLAQRVDASGNERVVCDATADHGEVVITD